jgi:hypothetical protein
MTDTPPAALRDWIWALLRVRALWPLPGLLLLAVTLPFLPEDAWRAQFTTRRTLSKAELAMLSTGVSCAMYWLVLLLGHLGLLHSSRSWGMREPSDAEQTLAAAGVRFVCLLGIYAGPIALLSSC